MDKGKHYRFSYKGINLDPFRIAEIYKLNAPQLTILKKVLVNGNRGYKDKTQDYEDIICAAKRAIEIIKEDSETDSSGNNWIDVQYSIPKHTESVEIKCIDGIRKGTVDRNSFRWIGVTGGGPDNTIVSFKDGALWREIK